MRTRPTQTATVASNWPGPRASHAPWAGVTKETLKNTPEHKKVKPPPKPHKLKEAP